MKVNVEPPAACEPSNSMFFHSASLMFVLSAYPELGIALMLVWVVDFKERSNTFYPQLFGVTTPACAWLVSPMMYYNGYEY